jgi:hypothetical protein
MRRGPAVQGRPRTMATGEGATGAARAGIPSVHGVTGRFAGPGAARGVAVPADPAPARNRGIVEQRGRRAGGELQITRCAMR